MKNRQQLLTQFSEANAFITETRSKYEGKDVTMPPDVEANFRKSVDDALDAKRAIEQMDQLEQARSYMTEPAHRPLVTPGGTDQKPEDAEVRAWREYLRGNTSKVGEIRNFHQVRAQQQVNPNTQGGFLVPTIVADEIIKPIDKPIFMRQICRVVPISSLVAIPKQTNRLTATWEGETETAVESGLNVGQRNFSPRRVTVKTSNSRSLIEMGAINVEAWLSEEIDYARRLKEEDAFMQGDGVGKPLGIFTPSADGISTSRDVTTAGASIAADDIIATLMNVYQTVRDRGSWVGSRQFVQAVMSLKDGAGQYIFTESMGIGNVLAVGTPMTLKGRPLYESESAPSTLAAGTYAAVFGDYSQYRIYDYMQLQIQVLDQDPYASKAELGYVAHVFEDAAPTREESFSRLKVKP